MPTKVGSMNQEGISVTCSREDVKYNTNRDDTMTTFEVAKIYVRHNTAIMCLTTAIMYGAYLSQIPETIWAAYILGVGGCVYLDKKSADEA